MREQVGGYVGRSLRQWESRSSLRQWESGGYVGSSLRQWERGGYVGSSLRQWVS